MWPNDGTERFVECTECYAFISEEEAEFQGGICENCIYQLQEEEYRESMEEDCCD